MPVISNWKTLREQERLSAQAHTIAQALCYFWSQVYAQRISLTLKSIAVPRPRVQERVSIELQVPGILVGALVREDKISGPVELQIPEALPIVLSTENWQQMP